MHPGSMVIAMHDATLEAGFASAAESRTARHGYRLCARCVMDTSDPDIRFDDQGICNHCRRFDNRMQTEVFRGQAGLQRLGAIAARIKREGRDKEYDCITGVSG